MRRYLNVQEPDLIRVDMWAPLLEKGLKLRAMEAGAKQSEIASHGTR